MSDENGKNKSTLVAVILLGLLILVIGAGAIFYINSNDPEATALVESTLTSDEDLSEQLPPSAQVEVEDTVPDEAVSVDVDSFMAPRTLGNPDAPIKIIEYASLTCGHCAHFHNDVFPALKEKYIDTGKVFMEFREFPLNDPALKATITARCLPADKYESFVSLLFQTQEKWATDVGYMNILRQNAKLAGLSDAMFDACQNAPALKLRLAEQMQTASDKYKITATPTFIINDGAEVISGAQPLENFERAFRAVTNNEVGEAPAVE